MSVLTCNDTSLSPVSQPSIRGKHDKALKVAGEVYCFLEQIMLCYYKNTRISEKKDIGLMTATSRGRIFRGTARSTRLRQACERCSAVGQSPAFQHGDLVGMVAVSERLQAREAVLHRDQHAAYGTAGEYLQLHLDSAGEDLNTREPLFL